MVIVEILTDIFTLASTTADYWDKGSMWGLLDIYVLVQSHCFSVLLSISVLCFGIKHTKDFHVNSATQLHVKNTSGLIHTSRLVFLMPYVTITCKTNLSLTNMI